MNILHYLNIAFSEHWHSSQSEIYLLKLSLSICYKEMEQTAWFLWTYFFKNMLNYSFLKISIASTS